MLENSMGNYIKELRVTKGLTQKELAEQIFVTNSAVSKWERGLGCPEINTLPLLATALETTVEELLQGSAFPFEEPPVEKIVEEENSHSRQIDLKAQRGKVFFFTSSILSTAFFLMIILINVILNLDSGLSGVLDIVQPLTVAWIGATSIIGFIPWLFFYLMDRYRMVLD
ncbi:helix-turn-helix domain-containing protein [Enterococcus malodoratus]|uniref:helix-turn-helix domain-containing protein n=1 Tax=Enterococcus malodoratus TaxID=71451 RepID=UPI003FCF5A4C